jgi:N-acetylmuramoyl-L-alanine amidase
MTRLLLWPTLWLILLGCLPSPAGGAAGARAGAVEARELRLRTYPTHTRVVLETDIPIRFTSEATQGEVRVRLQGLALTADRFEKAGDGLVKQVRLAPTGADSMLIVALESEAADIKIFSLTDPARVVIDVFRSQAAGPGSSLGLSGARPADLARSGPGARVPDPRAPEPRLPVKKVGGDGLKLVVIDPGHGGHDPGALGPRGTAEKDVTLDVSLRVAKMVEEQLGIKVAMTRSTDVFIPLRDRTSFANKHRADLFVSIHANAHPRSLSEGVETYFLSAEASDSDARQLAAIENGVIQLESPAARPKGDALKGILWDLAQSEFQHESSFLAETVLQQMTRSLGLVERGVKQAGFYVLGGATMPAILIEVGFLTNPKEERELATPARREAIARAIFAGLAEYKRRHDQRMRLGSATPVRNEAPW